MEPSPITIHLFGPLRVTVRGEPLPRARALLNVGRLARRREDRGAALRYWEEGLAIRCPLGDRHGIAELRLDMGQLQGDTVSAPTAAAWFAELALLEGDEMAARLGAAASAHDPVAPRSRPLLDQIAEDATPRAIRAALGEARCAPAWAEGRALTLAQAIEEAREELA
jgi:hypothetical protein